MVGCQLGITSGLLTYSYLQGASGFKMYPFTQVKAQSYAKIAMATVFMYYLGSATVTRKFGDKAQGAYLTSNKSAILKGTMPWEK